MNRSAEFSLDGKYRRRLDRWWSDGPRVGFYLLNPSIAGSDKDDPTVRKCTGFAARWGYSGITVVNPFDLICTDPRGLLKADLICMPANVETVLKVAAEVDLLIAGWGCNSIVKQLRKRNYDPMDLLRRVRRARPELRIECLGRGKDGEPKHPLMLAYNTPQEKFEVSNG